MKKTLFTIIGAILGLPLSYYFQPEMVRAKIGGISGYVKHFDEILEADDLIGNVVIGVVVFGLIGFIIGYFMDKANEPKTRENKQNQRTESPKINYEKTGKDIGKALASVLSVLLLNFNKVKKRIISNPKIVGIIGLIILILSVFYYVFIKNHPTKDGKEIAAKMCECYDTYNKEIIIAYSDFSENFDKTKYKQRNEARNALQNTSNPISNKKYNCIESINKEYQLIERKYNSDYKGRNKLELSYNQNQNNCSEKVNEKENALYNEISKKIETIKDPEPDKAKIKGDLIGNKILGWNFDYLSEFKKFKILNTTKNSSRIEYDIEMELLDEKKNSAHDCEVKVIYNLGSNGWYFNNVKMKYITYINTGYPDKWTKITPLKNCQYNVFDLGNKYWIRDGSYGKKYKGGPDGETYHLKSSTIYLMSRDNRPVKIKFKYKPNK